MLIVSALGYISAYGQNTVGVNTNTPNPNSVLELVSPNSNQGFLVPRISTFQRTSMTTSLSNNENGLMVFDTDANLFYYWNNGVWIPGLGALNITPAGGDLDGFYPNPIIRISAVTESKIADAAVSTQKLRDASVTTAKINNGAVTTAKIADEAVTGAKLEDSGVTAGGYGDEFLALQLTVDSKGRVTAISELPILITSANITDLTILNEDIANGTITISKIDPEGNTDKVLTIDTFGSVVWTDRSDFTSSALAQNNIYVGNASGVAEGLPVTGDVAVTNTGTAADIIIQDDAVQGDDLDVDNANFVVPGTQTIILNNTGGLQVNNPVDITSTLNADGAVNLAATGVLTVVEGLLRVDQQADFTGNLDANAGLDVTSGDFNVFDTPASVTSINNDDINIGDEATDDIDLTGDVSVNSGSFTVVAPQTDLNSTTTNIGDAATDALNINADVTITGEIQGANPFVLQGAVDNVNATTINVEEPTQPNTIVIPDESGVINLSPAALTPDLALSSDASGQIVVAADAQNFNVNSDVVNIGNAAADQATVAGNLDVQNGLDLTNGTLQADDNVILGATNADALTVNATADFNDAVNVDGIFDANNGLNITAGTFRANDAVILGSNDVDNVTINGSIQNDLGGNALNLEGATDGDGFQTSLAVVDPTQDNTITFPDRSGEVVLQGATSFTGNIALTSDAAGEIVEAVESQDFNVQSQNINLGDDVGDQITISGNTDAQNGLDVTGSDLTVGTTSFVVNNAGDLTSVGNVTLSSSGSSTVVEGTLQVNEQADFSANLDANAGLDITDGDFTISDTNPAARTIINTNDIDIGNAGTDDIDVTGVVDIQGGALTVATGSSATFNDAVTLGDAEADAIAINGTIQEGSLIAGTNALVLDGSTPNANRTTLAVTDPSGVNTITFPDASGEVVLQGATSYTGDLALTTDALGDIVEAVDGQVFNVNSNDVNIGNALTDQIDLIGDVTIADGVSTTAINANTITLGNAGTDDIDITGVVDIQGGNVTIADGATTTAINNNDIDIGNLGTDDIDITGVVDIQGGNVTIADGLTTTAINNNDIDIGNLGTDDIDITGVVDIQGGNVTIADGATTTSINNNDIDIGNLGTDDIDITGVVDIQGGSVTIADGATITAINNNDIDIGNAGTDDIDVTGVVDIQGGALTVATGSSATFNDAVTLGDAEADAIAINGTIQEGSLIAGTNALVLDGSTPNANRTTLAVTDPSGVNTITFPDASGEVVLQGATSYTGDLALTTDALGDIVEAVDGQVFNVNSNDVNIGNALTDQIDLIGDVTIADGVSTTAINANTITLGNAGTDDIDITGVVDIQGGNVTIADGATTTAINNNDIDIGNLGTDDIDITGVVDIQGGNVTIADGLTTTAINNNDIDIGNLGTDDIDITGVVDIQGGNVTIADGATTTSINNNDIDIGNLGTDDIDITGVVDIQGGSVTIADGATITAINNNDIDIGNAGTDDIDVTGVVDIQGGALTVATGSSATFNDAVTLGDAEADAIAINGTIQEGSLIAGTNALVLDGSTPNANRTTLAVTDPSGVNTITFPDASGEVVLQGATSYAGNLALTTDVAGDIVEAVDGQIFNVNSNDVNIGNALTDQIDLTGDVTIADGVSTTAINANTITLGNAGTDDIDITGVVDIQGGNVTIADGLTTTAINNNDIDIGNLGTDDIDITGVVDIQGGNVTIADGATTTAINNNDIDIGNLGTDDIDITGVVDIQGGNVTIADGATITAINNNDIDIGNAGTDDIDVTGVVDIQGGALTVATGSSATFNDAVTLGDAEADAIDINGTIQEGSLIAGTNALVLDGSTPNANRTTLAVTDPSGVNTITFPDASGEVVLQGATSYTGDLALTTDALGDIVEAVDGQIFNVNSNDVNIGNALTDQIDLTGDVTIADGVSTTAINANTITLGNVGTDDIDITGVVDIQGGNVTIADNVPTAAINSDDINIGDEPTDAIDVTGILTVNGTVNLGADAIQQGEIQDDEVTGAKLAPGVAGLGLEQDVSGNLDINLAAGGGLGFLGDELRLAIVPMPNQILIGSPGGFVNAVVGGDVTITESAGVITSTIQDDAVDGGDIDITGNNFDVNGDGRVSFTTSNAGLDAIQLNATSGRVDIDGSTGVSVDGGAASNFTTSSGLLTLQGEDGVNITSTTSTGVSINANTAGDVSINSAAGAVNIADGTSNGAVNIGTSTTGGRLISIGNSTGTTGVEIDAGSGGVDITGATNINGGALTVDDASTANLNSDVLNLGNANTDAIAVIGTTTFNEDIVLDDGANDVTLQVTTQTLGPASLIVPNLAGSNETIATLSDIAASDAMTNGTVYVGAGGVESEVVANGDGNILIGNGTTVNSVNVSGDIDIANTGVSTITAGIIDNADINAAAGIAATKLADGSVTNAELQQINNLNQQLATTDNVTFNNGTFNGNVTLGSDNLDLVTVPGTTTFNEDIVLDDGANDVTLQVTTQTLGPASLIVPNLAGSNETIATLSDIAASDAMTNGTVYVGAGGVESEVVANGDGNILIGNGTTVNSVNVSGDIDIANTGVSTITAGIIDNADINAAAGIAATKLADGSVTNAELQQINNLNQQLATTDNVTFNNGTFNGNVTLGSDNLDLVTVPGTTTFNEDIVLDDGANDVTLQVTTQTLGPASLIVPNLGGSNETIATLSDIAASDAMTNGTVYVGAGGVESEVAANGDGNILIGDGTTVNSVDVSGDIDIANTGVSTITAGIIDNADINAAAGIAATKLADGSVTNAELQQINNLNQQLATTDNVTFNNGTFNGNVTLGSDNLDLVTVPGTTTFNEDIILDDGANDVTLQVTTQTLGPASLIVPNLGGSNETIATLSDIAASDAMTNGTVYVGAGGVESEVVANGDGNILIGNGTTVNSVNVSGDIDIANTGVSTITAGIIDNADINAAAGIAATKLADGSVTNAELQQINNLNQQLATTDNVTFNNGTFNGNVTLGSDNLDLVTVPGTTTFNEDIVLDDGANDVTLQVTTQTLGPASLIVPNLGGSNETIATLSDIAASDAMTNGTVYVGAGGVESEVAANGDGNILIGNGTTVNSVNVSGDIDIANTGVSTITAGVIDNADINAAAGIAATKLADGSVTNAELQQINNLNQQLATTDNVTFNNGTFNGNVTLGSDNLDLVTVPGTTTFNEDIVLDDGANDVTLQVTTQTLGPASLIVPNLAGSNETIATLSDIAASDAMTNGTVYVGAGGVESEVVANGDGNILIGNGTTVNSVNVSGDIDIANTGVSTITAGIIDNADINAAAGIAATKLADGSVTNAELQQINNLNQQLATTDNVTFNNGTFNGNVTLGSDNLDLVTVPGTTTFNEDIVLDDGANDVTLQVTTQTLGPASLIVPNLGGSNETIATLSDIAASDAMTNGTVYVGAGGVESEVVANGDGNILIGNGTTVNSVNVSGDIDIANTGVSTITAGIIDNADINAAAGIAATKLADGSVTNAELQQINNLNQQLATTDNVTFNNGTFNGNVTLGSDNLDLVTVPGTTTFNEDIVLDDGANDVTLQVTTQTLGPASLIVPNLGGSNETIATLSDIAASDAMTNGTVYVGAGGVESEVAANGDGNILIGDGTTVNSVDVSGDIDIANTGVATITAGVIDNADINAAAGIAATKLADGSVTNAELQQINNLNQQLATTDNVTFNQVTGTTSISSSGTLSATGATTLNGNVTLGSDNLDLVTVPGTTTFNEDIILDDGANDVTLQVTTQTLGPASLIVPNLGGSNETIATLSDIAASDAMTNGTVYVGAGGVESEVVANGDGNILIGNGTTVNSVNVSGDIDIANTGVSTITAGIIDNADINAAAGIAATKLADGSVTNAELQQINNLNQQLATTDNVTFNNGTFNGNVTLGSDNLDLVTVPGTTTFNEDIILDDGANDVTLQVTTQTLGPASLIVPNLGGSNETIATLSDIAASDAMTNGTVYVGAGGVESEVAANGDGNILIGDGTTVNSVDVSGDIDIANTGVSTITAGIIDNADINAAAGIAATKLADGSVTNAELQQINNLNQQLATTDNVTFNQVTGTTSISSSGTLSATGATTLNGNVTLGSDNLDLVTVPGTTTFNEDIVLDDGANDVTLQVTTQTLGPASLIVPNLAGSNETIATLSDIAASDAMTNGTVYVGAGGVESEVVANGDGNILIGNGTTVNSVNVSGDIDIANTGVSTITAGIIDNADINAAAGIAATKLADGSVTNAELQQINNLNQQLATTDNVTFNQVTGTTSISSSGTLSATGATTLNGNVTLGSDNLDLVTVPGTTTFNEDIILDDGANDVTLQVTTQTLGPASLIVPNLGGSNETIATLSDIAASDAMTNGTVYVGAGGVESEVVANGDGNILIGNGTTVNSVNVSGDIDIANTGVSTITAGIIDNADINAAAGIAATKLADGSVTNAELQQINNLNQQLATTDNVTFNNGTFNGNVTLGSDNLDLVTVPGTTTFNEDIVLDDGANDVTLQVTTQTLGPASLIVPNLGGSNETIATLSDIAASDAMTNGTVYVGAGGVESEVAANGDGNILIGDGTTVNSVDVSGDIDIANTGVATITAGVIDNADINAAAGIAATKLADGSVTNAELQQINNLNQQLATTDNVTFNQVTGTTSISSSGTLSATGATTLNGNVTLGSDNLDLVTVPGTTTFNEDIILDDGANDVTLQVTTQTLGPASLIVPNLGGSNETIATLSDIAASDAMTNGTVYVGAGGVESEVVANGDGNILIGNGTTVNSVNVSGDIDIANTGVSTITAGIIDNADINAAAGIAATKLADGSVTNAELQQINNLNQQLATTDNVTFNNGTFNGNVTLGSDNLDLVTVPGTTTFNEDIVLDDGANDVTLQVTTQTLGPASLIVPNLAGSNETIATLSDIAASDAMTNGTVYVGAGGVESEVAANGDGNILIGNGTTVNSVNVSGDIDIANTGVSTITAGVIDNADINAAAGIAATKLADGSVTNAELQQINNLNQQLATTDNVTFNNGTFNGNVTLGSDNLDLVTVPGTTTFNEDIVLDDGANDVTLQVTTQTLGPASLIVPNLGGSNETIATLSDIAASDAMTNGTVYVGAGGVESEVVANGDGNILIGNGTTVNSVNVSGDIDIANTGVSTITAGIIDNADINAAAGIAATKLADGSVTNAELQQINNLNQQLATTDNVTFNNGTFNGNVTLGSDNLDLVTVPGTTTFNEDIILDDGANDVTLQVTTQTLGPASLIVPNLGGSNETIATLSDIAASDAMTNGTVYVGAGGVESEVAANGDGNILIGNGTTVNSVNVSGDIDIANTGVSTITAGIIDNADINAAAGIAATKLADGSVTNAELQQINNLNQQLATTDNVTFNNGTFNGNVTLGSDNLDLVTVPGTTTFNEDIVLDDGANDVTLQVTTQTLGPASLIVPNLGGSNETIATLSDIAASDAMTNGTVYVGAGGVESEVAANGDGNILIGDGTTVNSVDVSGDIDIANTGVSTITAGIIDNADINAAAGIAATKLADGSVTNAELQQINNLNQQLATTDNVTFNNGTFNGNVTLGSDNLDLVTVPGTTTFNEDIILDDGANDVTLQVTTQTLGPASLIVPNLGGSNETIATLSDIAASDAMTNGTVYVGAGGVESEVAANGDGNILIGNGTTVNSVNVSGDIDIANTGVSTITAGIIDNADINAAAGIAATKLADGSVTNAELQQINNLNQQLATTDNVTFNNGTFNGNVTLGSDNLDLVTVPGTTTFNEDIVLDDGANDVTLQVTTQTLGPASLIVPNLAGSNETIATLSDIAASDAMTNGTVYVGAGGVESEVVANGDGNILIGDGTTVNSVDVSGDIDIANTGVSTITAGVIDNADINAAAGIAATKLADGSVTNAELQQINNLNQQLATTDNVTFNNGTFNGNVTLGSDNLDLVTVPGTTTFNEDIVLDDGANDVTLQVTTQTLGPASLIVPNLAGSNETIATLSDIAASDAMTNGTVYVGAGGVESEVVANGDGNILIGNGTTVNSVNVSGDIDIANTGVSTITAGIIDNADINAAAGIAATKLADGSVTNAELQQINNLNQQLATTDNVTFNNGTFNGNVTLGSDNLDLVTVPGTTTFNEDIILDDGANDVTLQVTTQTLGPASLIVPNLGGSNETIATLSDIAASDAMTNGTVYVGAGGVESEVAANGDGNILIGDGTTVNSVDVSGDIDIANTGVSTITAGIIDNADINAAAGIAATKLADGSVTNAELQQINNLNQQLATTDNVTFNNGTFNGNVTLGSDNLDAVSVPGIATFNENIVLDDAGGDVTLVVGTQTGGAANLTIPDVGTGETMAFLSDIPAASSLQDAYALDNTLVTNLTDGLFSISGTEQISLTSSAASATAIVIDANNTGGGVDINAGTGTGVVNMDAGGAVSIQGGAASDLTLASNTASPETLTLSATNVGAGTGDIAISAENGVAITSTTSTGVTIDANTTGTVDINAAAGAINIGNDAVTGAINVGTGASARTITTGNASSTEVELNAALIDVNAGASGMSLQAGGASDITTTAGLLTLDGATGVSVVGNAAEVDLTSSQATASAIDINATNAAGGIDIDAGATSGVINMDAGGAVSIQGGAASDITTTSGNLNVTAANTLDMDGTSGVRIDAGASNNIDLATNDVTNNINIGTAATAAKTISIGNNNSTSAVSVDAGSGGIRLDATATTITGAVVMTLDPTTQGFNTDGAITVGGNYSFIRIQVTSAANRILTIANGTTTGQMLTLVHVYNGFTQTVTLRNSDTNLDLANNDFVSNPGGSITLMWTGSTWLQISKSQL